MTTEAFLFDYIRRHRYAVMASISPNGFPQSAYIGIAVTPDLKIIFDTLTDSRKYQNLLVNPLISLVIGGEDEQTVQYEGLARIPAIHELDSLLETYFAVFPDGKERKNWNKVGYLCVEPSWIRYSNFNDPNREIKEIKFN